MTATGGERGLDRAGVVPAESTVGAWREAELRRAADCLGIACCHQLGYQDSGIDGDGPGGFCQAPPEEAAQRLAAILTGEAAEVLVGYDERGIYGHPDHLQVHKVGLRAAQLADTASVFLATVDRERLQAMLHLAETFGLVIDDQTLDWAVTAGVAAARITTTVDVSAYTEVKRAALAAHETQFPPGTEILGLPPVAFQAVFGTEWYIALDGAGGAAGARPRTWLWDS